MKPDEEEEGNPFPHGVCVCDIYYEDVYTCKYAYMYTSCHNYSASSLCVQAELYMHTCTPVVI